MEYFKLKIIILGFALLLFGILTAVLGHYVFPLIDGILALSLIVVACFSKDEKNNDE